MNKNTGLIIMLIIFITLSLILGGFIIYDKYLKTETKIEEKEETKEVEEENEALEQDEKNEITADVIIQATGYAGSSNQQFYLNNNILYIYYKEEDKSEKIADKVNNIYKQNDMIVAEVKEDYNEFLTNNTIIYLKKTELTFSGSKKEIYYEKLLSPSGFSGSSSHIIYIKNNNLYYTNTNEISYNVELIATGVEDISKSTENIIVKTNSSFIKYRDLSFVKYE